METKSRSLLYELCTRNDILNEKDWLDKIKKNLKREGKKGSISLAQMINILVNSRSTGVNFALSVALEAKPTNELITAIRQILSTRPTIEGYPGTFTPQIFGREKIGWTDQTHKFIIKNAKMYLEDSKIDEFMKKGDTQSVFQKIRNYLTFHPRG